jgi:hypothetical protein
MRLSILFVILSAFLSLHCKPRGQSSANSLDAADLQALADATDKYNQNVEKLMIFIEGEDSLTDGGHSFVTDYGQLFRNNLGSNYQVYILSDAKQESRWFLEFENAVKFKEAASPIGAPIRYAKRSVTKDNLADLVRNIQAVYKNKAERAEGGKKVQMIVHFLAHGISLRGQGDGFVGLKDYQMPWRELATTLVEPLSAVADELIMVIESCYGGNVIGQLPNNFFNKNNALLIIGAPPWASQFAPTDGSGGSPSALPEKLATEFRSSVATMALKAALTGYASEGIGMKNSDKVTGESAKATPFNGPQPEDNIKFEGKDVKIFEGTTDLKEKHVVRVNEFIPYIEKKGFQINCNIYAAQRYSTLSDICASSTLTGVEFNFGSGLSQENKNVKGKIPFLMSLSKEAFVKKVNFEIAAVPKVFVYKTENPNASLNPNSGNGNTNGILSMVSMNLFRSEVSTTEGMEKFVGLDEFGLSGIDNQIIDCQSNMEKTTGDLYDVLKALADTTGGANPGISFGPGQGQAQGQQQGPSGSPGQSGGNSQMYNGPTGPQQGGDQPFGSGWKGGKKPAACELYTKSYGAGD